MICDRLLMSPWLILDGFGLLCNPIINEFQFSFYMLFYASPFREIKASRDRCKMQYMFGQPLDSIINKIRLGSLLLMGAQGDERSTDGWHGMRYRGFPCEECWREFWMISVVHAKRWEMKYMFGQHFDPSVNKIHLGSILIMGVQGDARCMEGWQGTGHSEEIGTRFLMRRL